MTCVFLLSTRGQKSLMVYIHEHLLLFLPAGFVVFASELAKPPINGEFKLVKLRVVLPSPPESMWFGTHVLVFAVYV